MGASRGSEARVEDVAEDDGARAGTELPARAKTRTRVRTRSTDQSFQCSACGSRRVIAVRRRGPVARLIQPLLFLSPHRCAQCGVDSLRWSFGRRARRRAGHALLAWLVIGSVGAGAFALVEVAKEKSGNGAGLEDDAQPRRRPSK